MLAHLHTLLLYDLLDIFAGVCAKTNKDTHLQKKSVDLQWVTKAWVMYVSPNLNKGLRANRNGCPE